MVKATRKVAIPPQRHPVAAANPLANHLCAAFRALPVPQKFEAPPGAASPDQAEPSPAVADEPREAIAPEESDAEPPDRTGCWREDKVGLLRRVRRGSCRCGPTT